MFFKTIFLRLFKLNSATIIYLSVAKSGCTVESGVIDDDNASNALSFPPLLWILQIKPRVTDVIT